MHTQYFAERVLFLLLAASIGFYSILQNPRSFQRSYSNSRNCFSLSTTSSMVLSHLIHAACDIGSADAAVEEIMVTAVTPIHLQPNDENDEVCTTAATKSITVEGIELSGHKVVDGIHLKRNGHGLRSLTYFGIGIRIYVAAMYTSRPFLSAEQAMETDNNPIQFDFTFLRYVRQSQVVSAWTQQLGHSVTHNKYEGYEADQARFIELASGRPIELGGTQSVVMAGDETRIVDQGKLTGIIQGRDFQKSFLSMWFGDMCVAEDLKANLLLGDEHVRKEKEQEVEQELLQQQQQQQQQQQTLVEAA